MRLLVSPLSLLVALVLCALPAQAQFPRDPAAKAKIEEAINTHYLASDFLKAEAVLTGTIKACENRCSPQLMAKAWMYVGVVRGGRSDQGGAKEAFVNAVALDPTVQLDAGVATVETQATFATVPGAAPPQSTPPVAGNAPVESAPPAPPAAAGLAQGNGFACSPAVTEVETRRPIPVECTPDEETARAELRYKALGADTWQTLPMERKGKAFRVQIPCEVTQNVGALKFYVQGKDAQGEIIVNWGSKREPIEIHLAEKSALEPPSYDDADPPARCAAPEICPPDFPGCTINKPGGGVVDWGGSCGNSSECKSGLLCLDGTCETAPACRSDSDCPSGTCVAGKCSVGAQGSTPLPPYRKWWFGLHIAQDVAFAGSDDPCMPGTESDNLVCYRKGSREETYDTAHFGTVRTAPISSGAVLATTRFLLSVDYAFTAQLTAGLRLGYALRGGPPAGRAVQYADDDSVSSVTDPGLDFLPFHVEARAAYWFGSNALGRVGLRPYVHGGGGVAQVDAKIVVQVDDKDGYGEADAWRKLGRAFITLGGGAVYAFTPTLGVQANLNGIYLMSASGLVLEPSIGGLVGF